MTDTFNYKGYTGSVEYSAEDECLYGKLQNIRDLVNYEADSAKDLKVEFEAAVDDYLETCEELGKEADKPYKGVFNVRTVPALHRDLDQLATRMGVSLNKVVTEGLTVIRDMVKGLPPGVFSTTKDLSSIIEMGQRSKMAGVRVAARGKRGAWTTPARKAAAKKAPAKKAAAKKAAAKRAKKDPRLAG